MILDLFLGGLAIVALSVVFVVMQMVTAVKWAWKGIKWLVKKGQYVPHKHGNRIARYLEEPPVPMEVINNRLAHLYKNDDPQWN